MRFIKNTAKAYLFFILIMPLILLIYTSIIYFASPNINEYQLSIISLFVLLFLFFIFGIITGLINKEKGLITGAASALILFTFIILINIITKSFEYGLIIKGASATLTSAIGGLLGINLCKKKKK